MLVKQEKRKKINSFQKKILKNHKLTHRRKTLLQIEQKEMKLSH